jgi:hypothetical protein
MLFGASKYSLPDSNFSTADRSDTAVWDTNTLTGMAMTISAMLKVMSIVFCVFIMINYFIFFRMKFLLTVLMGKPP